MRGRVLLFAQMLFEVVDSYGLRLVRFEMMLEIAVQLLQLRGEGGGALPNPSPFAALLFQVGRDASEGGHAVANALIQFSQLRALGRFGLTQTMHFGR